MKKIQCEVCGSIEITKVNDDTFRCSHCGCNYTLEQTRILFGGTVTAIQPDYNIRAGKLEKYNGEAVSAVIPSTVTIIGNDAFADCPGLESVIIPDSVKVIGSNAFSGCSGLTAISLPASIRLIEYGAFRGCEGLEEIEIPQNVSIISAHCFENCKNLKRVLLNGCITKIEDYAFNGCSVLSDISFPASLSHIGISAFGGCAELDCLYIPENVSYVGENAFFNCKGLTDITCESAQVLPYFINEFSPKIDVNNYIKNGRCRFCGGQFKGIFTIRCRDCATEKDYKIKKDKIIFYNQNEN